MAKGKYEYWLTPEGLIKIEGWARDGLTDEQISRNMGIVYSTFRVWKDKYSALSAALKKGKEVVDRQVENALFNRAVGECKVTKTIEELDPESGELIIVKKVTEELPPDTTAQIFWLVLCQDLAQNKMRSSDN